MKAYQFLLQEIKIPLSEKVFPFWEAHSVWRHGPKIPNLRIIISQLLRIDIRRNIWKNFSFPHIFCCQKLPNILTFFCYKFFIVNLQIGSHMSINTYYYRFLYLWFAKHFLQLFCFYVWDSFCHILFKNFQKDRLNFLQNSRSCFLK